MTLSSGGKIQQPSLPIPLMEVSESLKENEPGKANEDDASNGQSKEFERIIIRPGDYGHLTPLPFLSAFRGKKKKNDDSHILVTLKQVSQHSSFRYDKTSLYLCQILNGLLYCEKGSKYCEKGIP